MWMVVRIPIIESQRQLWMLQYDKLGWSIVHLLVYFECRKHRVYYWHHVVQQEKSRIPVHFSDLVFGETSIKEQQCLWIFAIPSTIELSEQYVPWLDAGICAELYSGTIQILYQWPDQNTNLIRNSSIFERVWWEDQ